MGPGHDTEQSIEELANDVRVGQETLDALKSTFEFDDPPEEVDDDS